MVHVDKADSASTKLAPHCQTILILISLKYGNNRLLNLETKWVNNNYKSKSHCYRKFKMATWFFATPWQTPFLFNGVKPYLAAGLMPS